MTKLLWDQTGSRIYEQGLDRGVLYLPNGNGVAWNGLSALEESFDDTSTPLYFDGVKYYDNVSLGDFAATVNAYTYPEEFLDLEGEMSVNDGMYVDGQNLQRFGLSYRTLLGNDISPDLGYRIHVLYNLTAVADSVNQSTLSDFTDPNDFSWALTSVPDLYDGHWPTSHLIIDTRYISANMLEEIENTLYGDNDHGPELPSLNDLIGLAVINITDNGDGTWTAEGPDELITMIDSTTFQISGVDGTMIDANTYQIQSTF